MAENMAPFLLLFDDFNEGGLVMIFQLEGQDTENPLMKNVISALIFVLLVLALAVSVLSATASAGSENNSNEAADPNIMDLRPLLIGLSVRLDLSLVSMIRLLVVLIILVITAPPFGGDRVMRLHWGASKAAVTVTNEVSLKIQTERCQELGVMLKGSVVVVVVCGVRAPSDELSVEMFFNFA
jgi:hypothetical protein